MSKITFPCPSCGHVLRVGVESAGHRGKCIKCGVALTIPEASAQPRGYDWTNVKLGALIALTAAGLFLARYGVNVITAYFLR